ncbi:MAG: dipeptide ABC transporter ATP-binding protein, partial [Tissierellia bacterium]|nr:dipeptide ABC transporter ATP-binding protein [Tissierellia bacterium]
MADVLLKAVDLKKYFPVKSGILNRKIQYVKALDGVNFEVYQGEVFGIVGESGCGKSTLGKVICNLEEKTSGEIYIGDQEISSLNKREMRDLRKKIQMVFQDPYASLNPRMSIRDIVAEPLIIHKLAQGKEEIDKKVVEFLRMVGLDSYHAQRYPHEFSGGQRQRIGIARALAVNPEIVIADEPVSALDVSIQSQVLNLLTELKRDLNLTYIFIAHDLSVVEHISDRIGVMYLGNFVEIADKYELYKNPLHPYTQALLSAIPIADPTSKKERIILKGSIPSALNPPSGCKFHTRCRHAMDICKIDVPQKKEVGENHFVF